MSFVLKLPNRQVKFFEEFKFLLQKDCVINPARQKGLGATRDDFWDINCWLQLAQRLSCKTDFLCTLKYTVVILQEKFPESRSSKTFNVIVKMGTKQHKGFT